MKKVILAPKKAVNEDKMLINGFFAISACLCGLLLSGPTGCALVPDRILERFPQKEDVYVALPANNVQIRKPNPLVLPIQNVIRTNNKYHQKAYLIFRQKRSEYINKLKSVDTKVKEIEKISEKELRSRNNYPLLQEHVSNIYIFDDPPKKLERRNRTIEEVNVRIGELEEELKELVIKRGRYPKYKNLYDDLIKKKSAAIQVENQIKKRWLLLFEYEIFLEKWYLKKLTANQPLGINKRYPRIIQGQYISKLGSDRQAIKDTNSTEWEIGLYHAIKTNARYPEDDNFDPLAFEIDPADKTVKMRPEAYEDEPFTGQVVFMLPSGQLGWAVIDRGLITRSTTEPSPIPTPENMTADSRPRVQGRLYQSYQQGQVTRSRFFTVDLAGKTFAGSLYDSKDLRLESQDYRSKEEKYYTGFYKGNPATTIDGFNRTKLLLSENGHARQWTSGKNNKVENELNGAWTLIDGQVHLQLGTKSEPSDNGRLSPNTMILEFNSENQLALIAEVRPDGYRTNIFAEPGKRFLHLKSQEEEELINLPEGTILLSQSALSGDEKGFVVVRRIDEEKVKELEEQIESTTDPAERSRLEGDLQSLRIAAITPYDGKIVEFWDKKGFQKKREETFRAGKHNGPVTWWYPNGQKHFEGEYLNGRPEGRTATYNESGSLIAEKFWETNKLLRATTWNANNQKTGDVTAGNGTLVYLHPNGEKQREETWENGTLKDVKFWDEKGKELESAGMDYFLTSPKQN